ncbi:hypothetical protein J7J62_03375 [bacterium]|nr:hypothetical protein [bacterium]
MAKFAYINLYRSHEQPDPAQRASSVRKLYTSILTVTMILTVATVIYFKSSTQIIRAELVEPSKMEVVKRKSLRMVISKRKARFTRLVLKLKALPPETLITDGDHHFIAVYSLVDIGGIKSVLDKLNQLELSPAIIDTQTSGGRIIVTIRGINPPALSTKRPAPIPPYERTSIMNRIDSLAMSKGLEFLGPRENIAIKKDAVREVFLYRTSLGGSYDSLAAFFAGVSRLRHAVIPEKFLIGKKEKDYELNVIWGLYFFKFGADTTKRVSAKIYRKKPRILAFRWHYNHQSTASNSPRL